MLKHASRRAGWVGLVGGLTVALGLAADEPKGLQEKAAPQAPKAGRGKVSGVILKVEPLGDAGEAKPKGWRLTLNTDVVWRDFVRDQAAAPVKASRGGLARAAEKGKTSVATEGHPNSEPLLAKAELDDRTEITLRYRSSTDSISEGAPTAGGAADVEEAADRDAPDRGPTPRDDAGDKGGKKAPKATQLAPTDLKPGLWVEVDSRLEDRSGHASRVIVLRPVGGPDVSPEKEKVPATKAVTPGP